MKMIGKYRKAVWDLHATHSTSRFPAGVCVLVGVRVFVYV